MLFVAAAAVGAILLAFATAPQDVINSATFRFARAFSYNLVNIYMIKIAAIFIISTSTVAVYTGFAPRWIALLGYASGFVRIGRQLLCRVELCRFSALGAADLSIYILFDNLRRPEVL